MLVVGGCLCECVAGIHTVRCLPIFCITAMYVHVDTPSNKVTFAIPHTHVRTRTQRRFQQLLPLACSDGNHATSYSFV